MMHGIAIMMLTGSGLALAAPQPEAPPPKLSDVYRANSDPALPSLPSGFFRTVASIAFSPDEQWIAVGLRVHAMQAGVAPILNSTLLLLPLHPGDGRRVEIDPGRQNALLWSPDSESLVVQTNVGRGHGVSKMYNLRGELVWTGPLSEPILGFIAPGRLLARHVKADGKIAGFDTIDIRTSAVTLWRAPRNGHFAAIDSERGLVAMFTDSEGSKTLIVDYTTGKVVQSVKNQVQTTFQGSTCYGDEFSICDMNDSTAPGVHFTENGKTLCKAALVGSFKNYPVCRDVDTGRTIAEFRGVDGGEPASASTRGSRMVLSKLKYLPAANYRRNWVSTPGTENYSGGVVWDFRTGSEVAAWGPSTRQTTWLFGGANGLSAPWVAISPLGNYVAEVLGDELRIYQIP
jgi:hypothetical protein